MLACKFRLNGAPMSMLSTALRNYPAFSGDRTFVNSPMSQCVGAMGPIPRGTYYIVDRESGGWRSIFDGFSKRESWFALYAADGVADDETFCDSVARGNFRLHPAVGTGRSAGCITPPFMMDFMQLRARLTRMPPADIPGMDRAAYGWVTVE